MPAARREPQRTLVVAGGRSPESLATKPLREAGGAGNPRTALRAFNAALVIHDERELPRPYLTEALPQLNSESWRVSPDGTMETSYRLRPNLTWHDGAPLTAEDFVFAARVYTSPEMGISASVPIRYVEEVRAQDARTVVVRLLSCAGGSRTRPPAGSREPSFRHCPATSWSGPSSSVRRRRSSPTRSG
jgi:ABC-type transport system substrate-binding protein